MTHPVSIIGGGVAGCVLSHALQQHGIANAIFERKGSTRFSGGALLLWSNAMRALKEVGLEAGPETFGQELRYIDFCSSRGRRLWRLRADRLARKNRAPCIVVPRAQFLDYLDKRVNGRVQHAVFERYEQSPSDVMAWFEGGGSVKSQILVGADGLRSQVRQRLEDREPRLRLTGQDIWVGSTSFRHRRLELGGAVASVGQGLRFWAAALPGDRVYWYAIFPQRVAPRSAFELSKLFRDFHDPVEELILETKVADIAKTSICDRHPASRWGQGRITLIGDAIHPVTPDLGQGACQAIESAVTLAEQLVERGIGEKALRRYERRRQNRTSRVSNMSYFTAVNSMIDHPLACGLRDIGIATLLPLVAAPQLRWITRGRSAR